MGAVLYGGRVWCSGYRTPGSAWPKGVSLHRGTLTETTAEFVPWESCAKLVGCCSRRWRNESTDATLLMMQKSVIYALCSLAWEQHILFISSAFFQAGASARAGWCACILHLPASRDISAMEVAASALGVGNYPVPRSGASGAVLCSGMIRSRHALYYRQRVLTEYGTLQQTLHPPAVTGFFVTVKAIT